jgi:hypothetical protein
MLHGPFSNGWEVGGPGVSACEGSGAVSRPGDRCVVLSDGTSPMGELRKEPCTEENGGGENRLDAGEPCTEENGVGEN